MSDREYKVFAIDFDGTCVTHAFPEIGLEIGAAPVLKKIIENGHKIILHTMRSDMINPKSETREIRAIGGNYLSDAIAWFHKHNIPLYGVNFNPTQSSWTNSTKPYADIYIDDAGFNVPLLYNPVLSDRAFVDWIMIERILQAKRIIF
jgi:hypothetical protein